MVAIVVFIIITGLDILETERSRSSHLREFYSPRPGNLNKTKVGPLTMWSQLPTLPFLQDSHHSQIIHFSFKTQMSPPSRQLSHVAGKLRHSCSRHPLTLACLRLCQSKLYSRYWGLHSCSSPGQPAGKQLPKTEERPTVFHQLFISASSELTK